MTPLSAMAQLAALASVARFAQIISSLVLPGANLATFGFPKMSLLGMPEASLCRDRLNIAYVILPAGKLAENYSINDGTPYYANSGEIPHNAPNGISF